MLACHAGCLESVELILMSGADPSIVESQGVTALDIAADSGHESSLLTMQAIKLSSQSSTTSPVLTHCLLRLLVMSKTTSIMAL